ncbi:MAG: PocR ligand-binding domain-containing protein, partial [Candidatus Omnitrophica bacterium]|nr:PocR ligand-binding domain-containing protein [Candidatus Omnitrophota bacterium]
NIFVVSPDGRIFMPPEEGKCGGALLLDRSLGFGLLTKDAGLDFTRFEQEAGYSEYQGTCDLRCFLLPVGYGGKTIAYVVVGPVVLNHMQDMAVYEQWAVEKGVPPERITGLVNELRVVSYKMMDSILDLLKEMIKSQVEKAAQARKTYTQVNPNSTEIAKHFSDVADEIFSTVRIDEWLATLLDTAIKMTNAQGGSIMLYDQALDALVIKVSKGLDLCHVENSKIKLGEGLSGIAAQEQRYYHIAADQKDEEGGSRIQQYLNRPDIIESLILPIMNNEKTCAVINLYSKKEKVFFEKNIENLKYLTQMLPAVF